MIVVASRLACVRPVSDPAAPHTAIPHPTLAQGTAIAPTLACVRQYPAPCPTPPCPTSPYPASGEEASASGVNNPQDEETAAETGETQAGQPSGASPLPLLTHTPPPNFAKCSHHMCSGVEPMMHLQHTISLHELPV